MPCGLETRQYQGTSNKLQTWTADPSDGTAVVSEGDRGCYVQVPRLTEAKVPQTNLWLDFRLGKNATFPPWTFRDSLCLGSIG
jgi:hypothetical protein